MRMWRRLMILVMTAVLMLTSSYSQGVYSEEKEQKKDDIPDLAPLYGEHDLYSSSTSTVIVELEEKSILHAKKHNIEQTAENLEAIRYNVLQEMEEQLGDVQITAEYDYVFSGFAIELPSHDIPQLLTISGIKAVYPDLTYTAADEDMDALEKVMGEAKESRTQTKASAPYIQAEVVNEAHGYTGEGVRIGILDTGVDYTHYDLEHAFEDDKGWDAIDADDDPQETQSGDPRGNETTHGTHVAGTIVGNGAMQGVAPGATLLAYRVLGPDAEGQTSHLIEGIERAVQDEVDVLNMSVQSIGGSYDWAAEVALDQAIDEGVIVVGASGNQGPAHETINAPGVSAGAIIVGASQMPYQIYDAYIQTNGDTEYGSVKVMGFPSEEAVLDLNEVTAEVVEVGLGREEDYKEVDAEGNIVLIERGRLEFVEKARIAEEQGAIAAFIYNHEEGNLNFHLPGMPIPTFQMNRKDGLTLQAATNEGEGKVDIHVELMHEVNETVPAFTSRGPVDRNGQIKPDLLAPGVNISSTISTHDEENPHSFAVRDGSSMAAPHVAGAVALLLEARPSWGIDEVKASLLNTARPVSDAWGGLYSHNTQGAGSVRVKDALQSETLVMPGSHSFGTFVQSPEIEEQTQSFSLRNLADQVQHYEIEVLLSGVGDEVEIEVEDTIEVPAKSTYEVEMNVQIDTAQVGSGYYEGMIYVNGGQDTIEVPTILFVAERDDTLLDRVNMGQLESGAFEFGVRLPSGADHVQFFVYADEPLQYMSDAGSYTSAPQGWESYTWSGLQMGHDFDPGDYHVYVYVEREGEAEIAHAGTFEVE